MWTVVAMMLAMHISEGVLDPWVLAVGAVLAAVGLIKGLRSVDVHAIPQVGMMAAALFVASLIHVPVGPTSVHLLLCGLAGLLLGWAVFPAMFVALLLQAILFQFGGLTTLGVNTVAMALPAVVVHVLFGRFIVGDRRASAIASFGAGALATLLAVSLAAMALCLSDQGFIGLSIAAIVAHAVLMVIEGAICAFCVGFLRAVRPDMLPRRDRSGLAHAA